MNPDQNKYYVIGIDLGTSSCKTVVMNLSGQLLGLGSNGYPANDIHSKWEEQNPDGLLKATILSVRKAIKTARVSRNDCIGISVGGALHSLIALDIDDRPLTGVMTWADNRATDQVASLRQSQDMHFHYLQSGCPNHPMYPLSKIVWLREKRSDLFKQISWFISAKEYLLLKLTGQHLVDFSIASGTSLLNVKKLIWDSKALEIAGIQSQQLSELCHPNTILELMNSDLTTEIGLLPKTPVIIGSSDATNSNLGVGAVHQDQLTCMVGTSGAIRKITKQPILDSKERTWCYVVDPDHWLVGGAINNGGLALQWLQHALRQGIGEKSLSTAPSIDDLLLWAEQVEPGADGLICLPFFTNERSPNWNPNARAVFYGLTFQHDQRHMARAVLEGIGYRLLTVLEVLDEIAGQSNELRASGGYTQSPFWLQLTANILNRKLLTTENHESSAVGAAYWAMIGNDLIDGLESIGDLAGTPTIYEPDLLIQDIYKISFQTYQDLYRQLKGLFDKTAPLL